MKGQAEARLQLRCHGVVQGVGFRPTVHRLASALDLRGSVRNVAGAVLVELRGDRSDLERFLERLPGELPGAARLEPLRPRWLPPPESPPGQASPIDSPGVLIAASPPIPLGDGLFAPSLAADQAPCADCLTELADPADRRHGYAFISCNVCGPRYSIATAEPYARAHTTLAAFPLCPRCQRQFDDPADRRFHAETIGCPDCGPRLELWDAAGVVLHPGADPIRAACALLAAGRILALQGVGGFQLLVDATNAEAVARLRRRKQRPAKPLALLVAEPAWMECHCQISAAEQAALASAAAPIVLLRRRQDTAALAGVAPGSPCLGVMLPASGLHHLLVGAFGRPLVATSGNRSGEPLCIDRHEAIERLGAGIADAFLVHDRPIARLLDDSVLQIIEARPALLRRSRGYAPEALTLRLPPLPPGSPEAVLALGGDLKSAPGLALGQRVWLAPHLGDLADGHQHQRLEAGVADIQRRHGTRLGVIACDAHPGYLSHQLAGRQPLPLVSVQHHLAHGLAVLAEHGLEPPLLVVAFDGLGYGTHPGHRLWGGELMLITATGHHHLAGLLPFPLPGGERAMAEPRRSALGLLAAARQLQQGNLPQAEALHHPGAHHTLAAFQPEQRQLLLQALAAGCNSPSCSSVGRLFDAVASLLGLCQRTSYEGQAGLLLEGAAADAVRASDDEGGPEKGKAYPLPLEPGDLESGWLGWLDWRPLLAALLNDIAATVPPSWCALRFHHALAAALAELAALAAGSMGCRHVAVAGGCFQNRLLLEVSIDALRARQLQPHWSEQVPCSDGGLALGQILAVRRGAEGVIRP